MYQQTIALAALAFVLAWREARRANALGAGGFYAIFGILLMPLSDYRFSPDIVNVKVFGSLIVAALLLMRIYDVAWHKTHPRKAW